MKDYLINVFFSEEDDCYVANIPDLRFCSAFGETPEKAVREVVRAKRAWLKTAIELGKAVPKPKFRPANYPIPRKKN